MFLWLAASLLILLFRAETHRMIPLYAEGVFIVFTLSQAGMIVHFVRKKPAKWIPKTAVNAIGIIITATGGITAAIVRFTDGVWILLVSIPIFMMVMHTIHKRYKELAQEINAKEFHRIYKPSTSDKGDQQMIVLLGRLTRSGVKLLNYANSLSKNVTVVSVVEDDKAEKSLQKLWKSWKIDVNLVVLQAPFREIVPPISDYITGLEKNLVEGEMITVLLTKVVDRRWYGPLLHNQSSLFIQRELYRHRDVVTILVPYVHD
jgi:K+ transporter